MEAEDAGNSLSLGSMMLSSPACPAPKASSSAASSFMSSGSCGAELDVARVAIAAGDSLEDWRRAAARKEAARESM